MAKIVFKQGIMFGRVKKLRRRWLWRAGAAVNREGERAVGAAGASRMGCCEPAGLEHRGSGWLLHVCGGMAASSLADR